MTVSVVLDAVAGVFLLLDAYSVLTLGRQAGSLDPLIFMLFMLGPFVAVIATFLLVVGLIEFVAAWGLLKGRNWARLATITISALGVIGPLLGLSWIALELPTVWAIVQGNTSGIIVGVLVDGAVIYMLTRPIVKPFFQEKRSAHSSRKGAN